MGIPRGRSGIVEVIVSPSLYKQYITQAPRLSRRLLWRMLDSLVVEVRYRVGRFCTRGGSARRESPSRSPSKQEVREHLPARRETPKGTCHSRPISLTPLLGRRGKGGRPDGMNLTRCRDNPQGRAGTRRDTVLGVHGISELGASRAFVSQPHPRTYG